MNDKDKIIDVELENSLVKANNNFSEVKSENKSNKNSNDRKKILSYVLVAILCSTFSGIGASIGTAKILKNRTSVSTDVINNSEQNQYAYTSKTEINKIKNNNEISSTASNNFDRRKLTVPEIAKKVGPSVVGVSTKGFPARNVWGWEIPASGTYGSGVIFSEDGYILTNYHVVNNAQTINVAFNNGKEVNAKLINYDENFDIAVIKVTDNVKMPAIAEFGNSDKLEIGELAIAIGNPLGRELLGSVTGGYISALNRSIDDRDIKFIQTDAAINPGNSGGPLINSYGEVIGINTEKTVGQDIEGLGFAIPINQIKPKIESLIKPRLMIGVAGREITKEDSERYNLPIGIYVQTIQDFSPAERAGIHPGDIIIKFDGKKIKTFNELNDLKSKHKSGDIVTVSLIRYNQSKANYDKTINIKLQLTP